MTQLNDKVIGYQGNLASITKYKEEETNSTLVCYNLGTFYVVENILHE